ncbi:hypothetical protein KKH27_10300 [bacterium]|nr:hypothetical protein [bacterium]MBU1984324.1 hypothetical protein [bacterium]
MNRLHRKTGRERFLIVLFSVLLIAFATRLVQIQILQHEDWKRMALRQFFLVKDRRPSRGEIRDRHGVPMAVTLPLTYAVGFRPTPGTDLDRVADEVARTLNRPQRDLRTKLASTSFVYLARKVDWIAKVQIEQLGFECLQFDEEPRRAYPCGSSASVLLGFTNRGGQGVEGVEAMLDQELSGEILKERCIVDAFRANPAVVSAQSAIPRGSDVNLTIDLQLQTIVENGLREGLAARRFLRAAALLVDPQTGDILALATLPAFDPNFPGDASADYRRCWPITDVYEPGSTLKIVPLARALETGRMHPSTRIFCENGSYRVPGAIIHDSHPHGELTLEEVLAYSSNIGAAKVSMHFSRAETFDKLRAFGFSNKTMIGLTGEQAGVIPSPQSRDWSGSTQATLAYGQGISCTALQLTMAFACLANGGNLMKPRIVRSITSPSGEIQEYPVQRIRQVVSESVAQTLLSMLRTAVERGTAMAARIPGVPVAGKTGTAHKVDFSKGTYYTDRYVSSFIGILPADNPRYVLFVVVDDPQGEYYGGVVATPVFRQITERIIAVRPDEFPRVPVWDTEKKPPDSTHSKPEDESPENQEDAPRPDASWSAAFVSHSPGDTSLVAVPFVEGLSMRQAMQTLSRSKLGFRIAGNRIVLAQTPQAGTLVPAGTACELLGIGD